MNDIAKLVSDYREFVEREGFVDAIEWLHQYRPQTWEQLQIAHTFALCDFWRDWNRQSRFVESIVGRVLV
jgi:hypothetical protein